MPTFPTFSFSSRIRPHVQAELDAAKTAEARGEFYTAFLKLERAHVLGQASTREHVRVHWHMLRFALRNDLPGEAFGQAWRLVMATVFTAFGLVPKGNSGGADVNAFRPMRIARDLQAALDAAHV
jgi:hypothetical protein